LEGIILVRRWYTLERNWTGRGHVVEGGYSVQQTSRMHVRQFAVDERDRTILISTVYELFSVHNLDSYNTLWTIPGNTQAQSVTQFDWSEGFLAFSTHSGSIEIWRRWTDVYGLVPLPPHHVNITTPLSNTTLAPSIDQLSRASPPPGPDEDLRGKYAPHAFVAGNGHSRSVRALRICFPTLIVIHHLNAYVVHVYDIAKGIKLRTIEVGDLQTSGAQPSQSTSFTGTPAFIDAHVSKNYVVVCYDSVVVVTAIRPEDEDRYPTAIITEPEHSVFVRRSTLQLKGGIDDPVHSSVGYQAINNSSKGIRVRGEYALDRIDLAPPPELTPDESPENALIPRRVSPMFLTVSLSPDERHLAIGSAFRFLYLFPDFARFGKGYNTIDEIIQRLNIHSPVMSIAWADHERRFAMTTDDGLTFIFEINPTYHDPQGTADHTDPASVTLSGARILRLADFRMLDFSGLSLKLQMTKTRLWLLWDHETLMKYLEKWQLIRDGSSERSGERMSEVELPTFSQDTYTASVCYIDFTPIL